MISPRFSQWLPPSLLAAATACWLTAAVNLLPREPLRETILLLDNSDSVLRTRTPAELATLFDTLERDTDHLLIVPFAGGLDRLPRQRQSDADLIAGLQSDPPTPPGSDPAAALRWTTAWPPAAGDRPWRRRVVLHSDGRPTGDDPLPAIDELARRFRLDIWPAGSRPVGDLRLLSVAHAPRLRPGAAQTLRVALDAPQALKARLDARWVDPSDDPVSLEVAVGPAGGEWTLSLPAPARPGWRMLEVAATTPEAVDPFPENNTWRQMVRIEPPDRIAGWGPADFFPAWFAPGDPLDRPESATPLWGYRGLVWRADAPIAPDLAERLALAVHGGLGLIVVGDAPALGAGDSGQPDAPALRTLARILPADPHPRTRLAVLFALDGSGSMTQPSGAVGTPSKWSVAASAVRTAWSGLGVGDWAGVFAFRAAPDPDWPPPAETLADRPVPWPSTLEHALAAWRPGGGTRWLAAVETALDRLADAPPDAARLIVLVTDGDTAESEPERTERFERIRDRLRTTGTRLAILTTNAFPDAWRHRLQHPEDGWNAEILALSAGELLLPRLLDAHSRRHAAFHRAPSSTDHLRPTAFLPPDRLPPLPRRHALFGPLRQRQGAWSPIILSNASERDSGYPLLAAWRYGLGRVVWVAGDPATDWGWPEADIRRLATALIDWTFAGTTDLFSVRVLPDRVRITAQANADPKPYAHWRPFDAPDTRPENTISLPLHSPTPGWWEADFRPPADGRWQGWLSTSPDPDAPDAFGSELIHWQDQREWKNLGPDFPTLARWARHGGGRLLSPFDAPTPWEKIPTQSTRGNRRAPPPPTFVLLGMILALAGLRLRARSATGNKKTEASN